MAAESSAALSEEIVALHARIAEVQAEHDALALEAAAQRAAFERDLEAFERARTAEEAQLGARVDELERALDAQVARAASLRATRCDAAAAEHAARAATRANNTRSAFAVLPSVLRVYEDVGSSAAVVPPSVPPPRPPKPSHVPPPVPPPARPPKRPVLSLSLDDSLFANAPEQQQQQQQGAQGTSADADPFASLLM